MSAETVIYKPYDGSDGLQVVDEKLRAWKEGEVVSETPVPADEDLPRLLLDFRAPELLPDVEFTMVPEAQSLDIQIDVEMEIDRVVIGTLRIDGEMVPWEARCDKGSDFLRTDFPAEARPWTAEDEPGTGWTISLTSEFSRSPDTVLCQRIALAIEAVLYGIAAGREIPIPYSCRISNVFSAGNPTWSAPLPRVQPLGA